MTVSYATITSEELIINTLQTDDGVAQPDANSLYANSSGILLSNGSLSTSITPESINTNIIMVGDTVYSNVYINSTSISIVGEGNTYIDGTIASFTGIVNASVAVVTQTTYVGDIVYVGNTEATYSSINATSFTGTANNATYAYGKAESALNVNSALTSNNSNNLGGVAAASYVNTSGAYTLSGNLTFNGNLTIGTSAGINANGGYGTSGQVLTSNGSTVYWSTVSGGGGNATSFAGTSQTFTANGTANTFSLTDTIAYAPDIIVSINGLLQTPTTHYTVSGNTISFTSIPSNNSLIEVRTMSAYPNGQSISVSNLAITGSLTANSSVGSNGQVLVSSGSSVYWYTIPGTNVNAQYTWTNTHTFTNTITFDQTINGTINNANYLGGVAAADYQTEAGLAANVATLTSNNANYLGGNSASDLRTYTDQKAGNAYSNALIFASNASNINTGTLAEARLPYRMDQNVRTTDTVNFNNLVLSGNLTVNGGVVVVSGNSVTFTDNMLYLNQGVSANITNISGNGSYVVFTANNNYSAGWDVAVTGVDPSSYNGTYTNIFAANSTTFTVANTNTASYVSGGTARGKSEANPDLGIAAGYNDGSYHHTGIFRDASDGVWKVFDNYGPEPDESVYIDTTNTTFHLADFQANTLYLGNTSTNWVVANSSVVVSTGTVKGAILQSTQSSGDEGGQIDLALAANTTLSGGIAIDIYQNKLRIFETGGSNRGAYIDFTAAANGVASNLLGGGFTNGQSISVNNFTVTGAVTANSSNGTSGQVLTTSGTGVYWSTVSSSSTPRVNTATTSSSLTWNSDNYDQYQLTALAEAVTLPADSGSPANGRRIIFRFKDNGTARALTWTTGSSNAFRAIGVTLPTTTVISKTLYVGCIYNSADSRWDVIAVAQES
jgi:hypothetical protein